MLIKKKRSNAQKSKKKNTCEWSRSREKKLRQVAFDLYHVQFVFLSLFLLSPCFLLLLFLCVFPEAHLQSEGMLLLFATRKQQKKMVEIKKL